jgi:hypothetical protein
MIHIFLCLGEISVGSAKAHSSDCLLLQQPSYHRTAMSVKSRLFELIAHPPSIATFILHTPLDPVIISLLCLRKWLEIKIYSKYSREKL